MGKFLVFLAVGFGVALVADSYRTGAPILGLGQLPDLRHPGFIPLETPRSTLVDGSASSRTAARMAYLSRGQQGLGEIDYFLT